MGKVAANKTWTFLDFTPLRASLSSVDLNHTVETPVVTTLGDTGPRRVEGNYDAEQSFNGFFDGVASGYDYRIEQALLAPATNYPDGHRLGVIFGSAATPQGYVGYEYLVHLATAPIAAANGAATLLNFTTVATDAPMRGTCICYDDAVTGTVDETGYNLGATGATEYFVCIMRVLFASVWGAGGLTVDIEQSDNDGAGDPYASIDAAYHYDLTAPARKAMVFGGVTKAWKRVAVTAFTATNVVLQVTAGIWKTAPSMAELVLP